MSDSENELAASEVSVSDTSDEVEWAFLSRMRTAISGQQAAFCCGGAIPVITENLEQRFDDVTAKTGLSSPPGTFPEKTLCSEAS